MRCLSPSCSTVEIRSRYLAASSNCSASAARCMRSCRERDRSACLPSRNSFTSWTASPYASGVVEFLDARAQAAADVVLQTRPGMVAPEVEVAGRDQKVAVDQLDHAVGQAGRQIGSVVAAAVLLQAPGDIDPRKAFAQREFDVRIGLVVAQQDVEARLLLLDEVVFQRQRFFFVVDDDVLEVDGFAQQGAGLGVLGRALEKIRTHPGAQVFRLADVDDLTLCVFVQIHARRGGQGADFLVKIQYRSAPALTSMLEQSATRLCSRGKLPKGPVQDPELLPEMVNFLRRQAHKETPTPKRGGAASAGDAKSSHYNHLQDSNSCWDWQRTCNLAKYSRSPRTGNPVRF